MQLQSFALLGLKHLPLITLQRSSEKYKKFLKFSLPLLSHSKKFSVSVDASILEEVHVQKYLNYIAREGASKNRKSQEQLLSLLEKKQELENEIKNLESMSSEGDKELEKLIESEKMHYLDSVKEVKHEILNSLLERDDENDNRNVELKIIPGIGGEEAKLFCEDLFQMYMNYTEFKNWEHVGDSKNGYIQIYGEYVFGHLKHEAGVHRVQRVPETESFGRVQSSTCSVIVLPQPKPHEIQISEKDITVERMRSSGPGGQNVNKRETCIRIRHVPSGILVEDQTSRYQQLNYKSAIDRLRGILFNMEQEKILNERKIYRKEQAGTNDYSDKIRTYNFPQNRVTDHRINFSIQNLKGFLSGGKDLDHVIAEVKSLNLKKEFLLEVKNTLETLEYKKFEKQQAG